MNLQPFSRGLLPFWTGFGKKVGARVDQMASGVGCSKESNLLPACSTTVAPNLFLRGPAGFFPGCSFPACVRAHRHPLPLLLLSRPRENWSQWCVLGRKSLTCLLGMWLFFLLTLGEKHTEKKINPFCLLPARFLCVKFILLRNLVELSYRLHGGLFFWKKYQPA